MFIQVNQLRPIEGQKNKFALYNPLTTNSLLGSCNNAPDEVVKEHCFRRSVSRHVMFTENLSFFNMLTFFHFNAFVFFSQIRKIKQRNDKTNSITDKRCNVITHCII